MVLLRGEYRTGINMSEQTERFLHFSGPVTLILVRFDPKFNGTMPEPLPVYCVSFTTFSRNRANKHSYEEINKQTHATRNSTSPAVSKRRGNNRVKPIAKSQQCIHTLTRPENSHETVHTACACMMHPVFDDTVYDAARLLLQRLLL